MKGYTCILFALLLAACHNTNNPNVVSLPTIHANATDSIITSVKPIVLNGCYQMIFKKDSALLRLQLKDSSVSGQLTYYFQEKDKNEGTLKGVVRDSLLIADYTFKSGEITSVREVIFKIHDTELWPAFGGLVPKNDTLVFRNKNNLQYDAVHPFVKVNCADK